MLNWILFCSCCAILAILPLAYSDSSKSARPLIIALPIRIQTSRSPRHMIPEDTGQEESEEEQQREQRLVARTFDPHMESHYPQRPEENSNRNENQSPQPFLAWNPANKLMVLQINDVINFRKEDDSESEENERTEEPPPVKPRQHWAYQGAFDFEDSRRINSKRKDDHQSPRLSTTKKRKNSKITTSSEDSGDDVYGADPVVHYLRSKSRKNDKHFDFSELPDEAADDEFNMREWWRY